ncbi:MAG: hypothetical protein QM775_05375 [Pirellulales bacterium]
MTAREAKLRATEKEWTERDAQVTAHEAMLDVREQTLATNEADLAAREQALSGERMRPIEPAVVPQPVTVATVVDRASTRAEEAELAARRSELENLGSELQRQAEQLHVREAEVDAALADARTGRPFGFGRDHAQCRVLAPPGRD